MEIDGKMQVVVTVRVGDELKHGLVTDMVKNRAAKMALFNGFEVIALSNIELTKYGPLELHAFWKENPELALSYMGNSECL